MINFLMTVAASGIFSRASSQLSAPEPLYLRGCRSPRGQFAHEGYCDQYYNCWDGRATIEECPGELLFNPATSTCDYPQAVNCAGRVRKQGPRIISGRCQKRWGTFADPLDCSTFYECDNFVAHWKRCPYYTAFDEHLLVCVHAYDVDCAGRGGVHGTYAPPVFRDAAGPASARIGSPAGGPRSGQERQYEKPVSSEATFRCPHPRGLYPNALDCGRFWLCREYKPSLLKCPAGQLFDLASLACVEPDKAQCSSISPRT